MDYHDICGTILIWSRHKASSIKMLHTTPDASIALATCFVKDRAVSKDLWPRRPPVLSLKILC